MIPVKDNLELRGPVAATALLIAAGLICLVIGLYPVEGTFQVLFSLYALWLFGAAVERRVGSIAFAAILIALTVAAGFVVGGLDGSAGAFALTAFIPVAAICLAHLALFPRSRIVSLLPLPFAMGFFEIPAVAIAAAWVCIEALFEFA